MHPLKSFKYCPKCGSGNFQEKTPVSKKCADCGFEHFKNPPIGVGVVIWDSQDRLVCVRRANEPGKGLLALPGGFTDLGETIEETAIRETMEETGLNIELTGFLSNIPNSYIYAGIDQYPLDFYFSANITDDSHMIAQKKEVLEIIFVPRAEINIADFAMQSTRILLEKILKR